MGGSAKGSGGGGSGDALEQISKDLFSETTPLRQETINQFMEALTTGGVGARMPIVNKATEASKRATSQNIEGLDDRLAVMGLSGTPFGESTRAGAKMTGDLATSQIGPNMASQMMQMIPSFVTGQGQTVVTGLGQAGQVQNQAQSNAMAPWLAAMDMFNFGFGG